jgi:tetratricopeptide (TPR) repeat protein
LYLGLNAYQQKNLSDAKKYLQKAVETTGTDEERNNYQIRRAYFVLGRIAVSEGAHEEGGKLLARVKEFQQKSLANSADTINATMQQEGMGGAPGVVPVIKGAPSTDMVGEAQGGQTAESSVAAAPIARPAMSASQLQELDAREKELREILASSFNDLGTAEARQQQYVAALADFHEAERWDASTPGLLRNIGVAAFRQNDFAESARALEAVLKSNPSDQRSRLMLAMSLFSLEKFAEADKAFALVSDAAMNDPRAAYAWAYSLAHTGQMQKANEIADKLVGDALPPDVLTLVCHLYTDSENYEHSVTCFRKAYQENPSIKQAHYEVGASLIHLDRPAEAIPELQQELTISPDDPEVQYYLAYALLQTSHKMEAAALLQTVIAAKPDHAQAQYQLGKLLLEDGKTEQAIKHLEIAEQYDPATDYIHYQLQSAYRKAGRTADADREAQIYREIKAKHREIAPEHAMQKP